MLKIKCPCCEYFTHVTDEADAPFFEICEVCYWQYDIVAHDNPDKVIGSNHISLNDAKTNYKQFHACKKEFSALVREPLPEELC
jgi:hypothetical protein